MRMTALIVISLAGWTSTAEAQRTPAMVPADWAQAPRQSPSEPLRYTSPDGTAWLALYATPADKRGKLRLAGEGEKVTYRRVTPRFAAVSGYKGDRIFYRKSNLACRGTRWHHVALEYPAEDKRKLDGLVTRVAHSMNRFDNDCRGSATTTSGGLVRGR
jgi:serine/threonine-protein kinase